MKITAITKYKNGEIYQAIKRLGWSQSELARRCGVSASEIGMIINLNRRPQKELAEKIQNSLAEHGEFIDILGMWPESFLGVKTGFKKEVTEDIQFENMVDCKELLQITVGDSSCIEELSIRLDDVIGKLTERESKVIRMKYYENKSTSEIGREVGITRERIRQCEKQALRRLKHPCRIKELDEIRDELSKQTK